MVSNDEVYTGLDAQTDPDFLSDWLVDSEIQEIEDYISLYSISDFTKESLPDYLKIHIK